MESFEEMAAPLGLKGSMHPFLQTWPLSEAKLAHFNL
jgi:hypothetical protein